ncbi:hypothetical protein GOV12_02310 [Candidatus Pacearchaeota archaeon]|nr:hypothetical protein [Candidatus Pacearchaeota archaeon]
MKEKRIHCFKLYLSKDEVRRLTLKSEKAKKSKSEYLRDTINFEIAFINDNLIKVLRLLSFK